MPVQSHPMGYEFPVGISVPEFTELPATSRRRCHLPSTQAQRGRPAPLCSDVSRYRNRETLMRRKAAEPHLEDSGIYRKRWWARVDCRQNYVRFGLRPRTVSLPRRDSMV